MKGKQKRERLGRDSNTRTRRHCLVIANYLAGQRIKTTLQPSHCLVCCVVVLVVLVEKQTPLFT